jgi:hypothetical protein
MKAKQITVFHGGPAGLAVLNAAPAVYFTPVRSYAELFASRQKGGGEVYTVELTDADFVRTTNPAEVYFLSAAEVQDALARGIKGYALVDVSGKQVEAGEVAEYVAFNAKEVA